MFQLTVHYLYGVVGVLVRRHAEQEQQREGEELMLNQKMEARSVKKQKK